MKNQTIKIENPGKYEYVVMYDVVGETKGFVGVVDGRTRGEYEVNVVAQHLAEDTKGKIVVKAVVADGAQLRLKGMIKIDKKAQGTDNFLELRVLILDDQSRATAEPLLEIEANNVKAGHAASVSKINEEQVLYLMSRGMSKKIAEEEIVAGWLG